MEQEVLILSPCYKLTEHVAMARTCTRGDSDWTLGKTSLPREYFDTGTGFLERWLVPCACSRHIWIMPLIICFNFGSAPDSWTRLHL